MDEPKYTLDEAVALLAKQQCAEGSHAPTTRIATFADPVGFYLCDCGAVRWKAQW